jgi:hypothetical protein
MYRPKFELHRCGGLHWHTNFYKHRQLVQKLLRGTYAYGDITFRHKVGRIVYETYVLPQKVNRISITKSYFNFISSSFSSPKYVVISSYVRNSLFPWCIVARMTCALLVRSSGRQLRIVEMKSRSFPLYNVLCALVTWSLSRADTFAWILYPNTIILSWRFCIGSLVSWANSRICFLFLDLFMVVSYDYLPFSFIDIWGVKLKQRR